jgi:hypothetical protein
MQFFRRTTSPDLDIYADSSEMDTIGIELKSERFQDSADTPRFRIQQS